MLNVYHHPSLSVSIVALWIRGVDIPERILGGMRALTAASEIAQRAWDPISD